MDLEPTGLEFPVDGVAARGDDEARLPQALLADRQDVARAAVVIGHHDAVQAVECRLCHHLPRPQDEPIPHPGGGSLQVQCPRGDLSGADLPAQRFGEAPERLNAGVVRAAGAPHDDAPANRKKIAALERPGGLHGVDALDQTPEDLCDLLLLAPARQGPEPSQQGPALEDDGGVLREAGIGMRFIGAKLHDLDARRLQQAAIGGMLGSGTLRIDAITFGVPRLRPDEGVSRGPHDRDGPPAYHRTYHRIGAVTGPQPAPAPPWRRGTPGCRRTPCVRPGTAVR